MTGPWSTRLDRVIPDRGGLLPGGRVARLAVVLYVGAGLALAAPPSTPWGLVVPTGAALLVVGLRTGRAVPVGLALALAGGARVGRVALDGAPAPGGAVGVVVLALVLAAVGELVRLAVDAGARRGPVRVAAGVRHRLLVDGVLLAGLALVATITVSVLTAPRWGRPPGVFLPLGLLALPSLAAVGTWLAVPGLARTTTAGAARSGLAGTGRRPRSASPGARRRPRRPHRPRPPGRGRPLLASVVVAAAVGLPLLAGLGARATGPFDGRRAAPEEAVPERSGSPDDAGPGLSGERPEERTRRPPSPPLGLLLGVGLVGLVTALLLGGGEGLVSADDRRPDTVPGEEPLRGAPAAPEVDELPPEVVAGIVDDALRYLRAELEPRLAVRCAYAAVAGGFGRHELARRPAETELEFLARQLGRTPEEPAGNADEPVALARLTELFEVARFSDRPIDAAMRAEALTDLEAVRRRLAGLVPADPGGRPAVGGPSPAGEPGGEGS